MIPSSRGTEALARDLAISQVTATKAASNRTWPLPLKAALSGIVGEFVARVLPTTEADPAALLVQFLAMFGNIIGRTAHWIVEDTRHFCNLNVCIVGDTAHGRKGTSGDRVRAVFKGLDETWDDRVRSGLSTGEGLIWFVRDPISEAIPQKEKGRIVGFEEMVTDPGETDKRVLVVESEFARVLQAVERHGNTLSPVIRDAWDGKPLGVMTKAKAAQCREPHVSIVAHVTTDELRRLMTDVAIANGFANRFMFACVRRSKMLPHGGDRVDLRDVRIKTQSAINHARRTEEVAFDAAAREYWAAAYVELTAARRGMFGSVTARAEAQARRIACLYAILDESPYIRVWHLEAALDLWRYAEDSAR
ncbi:MAG: DUF3987 domain-containing protein, partial [Acidobacteria bacterium]|nr:DUF3987 domain-containing protein [Acidobacteriota bacterium]